MNATITILAVLGIPALMAASSIWRGYVLSILWGWFIVPTFGAPTLSIPLAIGLSLIVGFLTHQMPAEDEKRSWSWSFSVSALFPALALLTGWIVTKFI